MQQRGVLADEADRGAHAFLRHVANVLPVDADRAVLHVEQAQGQVDQRRLAGAGAADEADLLARRDRRG